MPLSLADDPDGQIPMPFEAADHYAQWVMSQARQTDFAGLNVRLALAYGSHPLQCCDVFIPQKSPCSATLIFWHGGGWTNGYRAYVHFMAQHVCALGMALVAPSYRLAPANRLPAAYEDALSCLSFVQIHAANWGIHTQRLILSGHSAGGHLAALVALRARPPHVAACMPISAIVDLHHPAPSAGSLEERMYTLVLDEPSEDAPLSPIHWTTGNSIAFVLTVGEQDSPRVLAGNRRMQALLSLQTAPSSLHVQPGQSHFDTHTSLHNASHPWYKQLRHLAVQSPQ